MESNKQYGLIGYPLTHSFSKKYFEEKFLKQHISGCQYNLYPLENITSFPQLIKDNPLLRGLNVTIPYKETVIPFLNEVDGVAAKVGAVNCIKFLDKERQSLSKSVNLAGYNTDVYGFRQSIKPFLESQHSRALILGTGGGAKAVAYVLNEIGIDCYFVSRLKTQNSKLKTFLYEELNEAVVNTFKLIVNTTPLGMFPNAHAAPALPYRFISSFHLLYDLIYNPSETEFMKRGKQQGATVVNGLSMLHFQAEEAWRIWNS